MRVRRWEAAGHPAKDPLDYVEAFAYIIQAADAHGLQLVSPTVRRGTDLNEPAQWLAQFIGHCDEDTTYNCDPDKIALFDLHHYHCKADKWEGDNTFVDQAKADLKTSLATYAPSRSAAEWEAWVDARTFWVTETKCAPLTALTPGCPHTHARPRPLRPTAVAIGRPPTWRTCRPTWSSASAMRSSGTPRGATAA